MGVGQPQAPADVLPGMTQFLLYWNLGGSQGRFGLVWKKPRPPPGLDPRTVQPVASRYKVREHSVKNMASVYWNQ
jgi:hypothetical protein